MYSSAHSEYEKLSGDARPVVRLLLRDRDTLVTLVHLLAHLSISFGLLGAHGKREAKYAAAVLRSISKSIAGGAESGHSRVVAIMRLPTDAGDLDVVASRFEGAATRGVASLDHASIASLRKWLASIQQALLVALAQLDAAAGSKHKPAALPSSGWGLKTFFAFLGMRTATPKYPSASDASLP